MTLPINISRVEAMRIAADVGCDPRTVEKAAKGERIRSVILHQRLREALQRFRRPRPQAVAA